MTNATAHPDHRLISSEDVQGTDVYGMGDEVIGQIDHLLIEKVSGLVAYAVMSFGGFLGLAHSHYPIPWSALKYDTGVGGYRTGITEQQLKDAPTFSDNSWHDRDWETRTHQHYGARFYWSRIRSGVSEKTTAAFCRGQIAGLGYVRVIWLLARIDIRERLAVSVAYLEPARYFLNVQGGGNLRSVISSSDGWRAEEPIRPNRVSDEAVGARKGGCGDVVLGFGVFDHCSRRGRCRLRRYRRCIRWHREDFVLRFPRPAFDLAGHAFHQGA